MSENASPIKHVYEISAFYQRGIDFKRNFVITLPSTASSSSERSILGHESID